MLSLFEIQNSLKDRRISFIAHATGLHYNTIREIRDNPEANPTHKVLKLLSDYLTNPAYNGQS